MTRNRRNCKESPRLAWMALRGPWSIFLASLLGMFAVAPLLERELGEFWSLAAFLPVWAVAGLLIHMIRILKEVRYDRG
jgi:hypothetical protein